MQIDSVNVLCRSQYLPFFSRLGPYDRALLDRARDVAPRRIVEYWAHEASLVPPSTWPLLDFRMRRARSDAWGGMRRVAHDHPDLVAAVLSEVARRGPLTSRQLEAALAHDLPRQRDDWGWNWSLVKSALEHLFWAGEVSSAGRTTHSSGGTPCRPGCCRRRCARWPSIPTPARPRTRRSGGWSRSRPAPTGSPRSSACATTSASRPSRPARQSPPGRGRHPRPRDDRGVAPPAYLHRDARRPRRVQARALLSPFDSLIWQRDRTRAIFGFDYRLEIYVPAQLRRHGYYVLPFLLGEDLVARVDLKADRAAGVLRVRGCTWEPGRGGEDNRRGSTRSSSRWPPGSTSPPSPVTTRRIGRLLNQRGRSFDLSVVAAPTLDGPAGQWRRSSQCCASTARPSGSTSAAVSRPQIVNPSRSSTPMLRTCLRRSRRRAGACRGPRRGAERTRLDEHPRRHLAAP